MSTIGHRISFYVSDELYVKATETAAKLNQTVNDFARNAIRKAVDDIEKTKQEQELVEGYKANYQYYLDQNKAWENTKLELP